MKNTFVLFAALIFAQSTFASPMTSECRSSLTRTLGYIDILESVSYVTNSNQSQFAMTVRYKSNGYNYGKTACVISNSTCSSLKAYDVDVMNACTYIQKYGAEPKY